MKTPAVSLVIPVRNSGKYFSACLDSVVRQSLRNIEILIMDDASRDGSGSIADEYAARDSRISVLHQQASCGAGGARNAAMAAAQGKYIAFMDSDDLYPSDTVLEMLYEKAEEKNAVICGGSLYVIDERGRIRDSQSADQVFEKEGWHEYQEYQYDGGFYRFLYRRTFLEMNNLTFPEYRRFQDPVFFVQAMVHAGKFYAVTAWTYAYRKGHKSVPWNRDNIEGRLCGIKDILKISETYSLPKLHYNIVKNFLNMVNYNIKGVHYKIYFLHHIFSIIMKINWNVIDCQNKVNKTKISLLKILYYFIR